MRAFHLAAVLAGLVALPLSAAQAAEIEGSQFKAGDHWVGYAETGDDGQFLMCSVSIVHGGGQQLWFLLRRDDRFFVTLTSSIASFTPGAEFETTLAVEGGQSVTTWAWAADGQTMVMSFPGIDDAISYFRQGGLVSFTLSPTKTLAIGTPDVGPALDAAKACLQRYSAPG